MIKVSAEAREFIERRRSVEPDRKWFLFIEWRLGEMNNSRAADGSSVWRREPDKGWVVNLIGYDPKTPFDGGEQIVPGVRAVLAPSQEHPFPGGEIVFEDGWLRMEPHAT